MAAIFGGALYCDDCADDIKKFICNVLWNDREVADCPDGVKVSEFNSPEELALYLDLMDESNYDSDYYPKYCSDSFESDVPEHCASGEVCLNYDVLKDGRRIGHFFGNDLTADGAEYVRSVKGEGCVASELWIPYYELMGYNV